MRLVDILFSVAGLTILFPFLLVVALAVKIHDGGTVFYRGRRVGVGEKVFEMLKFRTMIPDAHRKGGAVTTDGDDRMTPLGRWLRKYKIDEFPQLINVAKGEMSLVGPRPEDPKYVSNYTAEQRKVLSFRPGITSPASLAFRHEQELLKGPDWETTYINEVLPQKLALELEYFPHRTLLKDLRLILRSIGALPK